MGVVRRSNQWTPNPYDFAFRGFILFLTGFFGPGTISAVPPAAVRSYVVQPAMAASAITSAAYLAIGPPGGKTL